MRVVLDTDVLVAALRSRAGTSRGVLQAVRWRDLQGLISVPLLFEYEAVMTRPEHLRASGASSVDVGMILDVLAAVMEPVEIYYSWRPLLPDPSDEMVLETAINGRADAIVTFNARDYRNVPSQFGLDLMRPADVLRRL